MTDKNHSEFDIDNLPNRLTMFRILLIPIILGSLLLTNVHVMVEHRTLLEWLAAFFFTLASITDFVDGYIARKKKIVTLFGSFLDPIADKFLTVSCLIVLMSLDRINVIVVVILVMREIYMTSLRLLASTEGITVPVSMLGKWKTGINMAAIPFIMLSGKPLGIPVNALGDILIYIASFLSVYSSFIYSMGLIGKIKQNRKTRMAK
ncbi:CDP-diacylglycerol--glycerol-3-phosphate 3-phosphatidyltransferase [Bacteriovoracaceae bacterium]|nr:CDP-diacylglycerol--glycerol-3-phosphate 3-phosphatidyltransferase [Bacteriovoracaceae bacterium]